MAEFPLCLGRQRRQLGKGFAEPDLMELWLQGAAPSLGADIALRGHTGT